MTVGTNNGALYPSGWFGGSAGNIETIGLADALHVSGIGMIGLGGVIDYFRWQAPEGSSDHISGVHFSVNQSIAVGGLLFSGAWVPASVYFVIDATPGGAYQYSVNYPHLISPLIQQGNWPPGP